tara:strand:- start:4126 stop:5100 length:975 start_codon:yes stop_codon:yes gene_type:complete
MVNNLTTSIIIRALNEGKYIGKLLYGLQQQAKLPNEIILVDSGSTDETLLIASSYGVKIVKISKEEFTFGRSLNIGCNEASGDILIFLSAHVYPSRKDWLQNILKPFKNSSVVCSFGKQRGNKSTKYSENQILLSYFPDQVDFIKTPYFCNNANCAIRKSQWEKEIYDESLTGLEDLDWAKKQYQNGFKILYAPEAEVIHVHEENWRQIKNRYKREAIALKRIEPNISMNYLNIVYLIVLNIFSDFYSIKALNSFKKNFLSIILFRINQYFGTYEGLNFKTKEMAQIKSTFYYPPNKVKKDKSKKQKFLNSPKKSRNLINYDSF